MKQQFREGPENENSVPLPPAGRLDGLEIFRQRVREMIERAAADSWREIIFCDPDFADWPLGERAVETALNAWSKSGGRATLIAQGWDETRRRHARFVNWRRRWSHLIEARECKSADPAAFPSAIWSSALVIERIDLSRSAGMISADARRKQELRETLSRWLHLSSPGFSASTLGL